MSSHMSVYVVFKITQMQAISHNFLIYLPFALYYPKAMAGRDVRFLSGVVGTLQLHTSDII